MRSVIIFTFIAIFAAIQGAVAQSLDQNDFQKLLNDTRKPSDGSEQQIDIDAVIARTKNKLVIKEAESAPAAIAKVIAPELTVLPTVEVSIQFEFNSSDINANSIQNIAKLASVLKDPRLFNKRIIIAGHTDAKGTAEYNMLLSQKRADAVRAMLIGAFGVAPERLFAIGLGEQQLKNSVSPEDAVNRRVEIINAG